MCCAAFSSGCSLTKLRPQVDHECVECKGVKASVVVIQLVQIIVLTFYLVRQNTCRPHLPLPFLVVPLPFSA